MEQTKDHHPQFKWRLLDRADASILLSISEAIARSGLSARVIQRAIQSGELPVQQIDGRVGWEYRIALRDIDAYSRQHGGAYAPIGAVMAGAAAAARPTRRWIVPALLTLLAIGLAAYAVSRLIAPSAGHAPIRATVTPAPPRATSPAGAGYHATPTVAHGATLAATATTAGATPTTMPIIGHATPTARPNETGSPRPTPCAGTARCAGGTAGLPGPPKSGGATTNTSFTVEIRARAGDRRVVVSGAMTLRRGLTPVMRAVYWGCAPVDSSQTSGRPSSGGSPATTGPLTLSTVDVTSTVPLPAATVQRLKQWAATFSSSLNTDDPPLIGIAIVDEPEDLNPEGASLWVQLRRILGPGYTLALFSEQRHGTLWAGSGAPCTAKTASSSAVGHPRRHATGQSPNGSRAAAHVSSGASAAQATLVEARRWLASIPAIAGSCVGSYRPVAAQLNGVLGGTANQQALAAAIARESRLCQGVAIPPVPARLARNQAVQHAYAALATALRSGRDIGPALANVATGNISAPDLQGAIDTLRRALLAYHRYETLARTLRQ